MKIFDIFKTHTHTLLLGVCVLLFLNLMTMCGTSRSVNNTNLKIDSMEKTFAYIQNKSFDLQRLEIDQKLTENLMNQQLLLDKQLITDSIKVRLKATMLQISKLKNDTTK